MHEKMTDEELRRTLAVLGNSVDRQGDVEGLRAHIAALTAERDEARVMASAASTQNETLAVELSTLRERTALVERQYDDCAKRALALAERCESLRERVRVLEADARRYWEDMRFAQSRLSALRERARMLVRDAARPDVLPETTNEHGERMVRVQWSLVEALRDALSPDAPEVCAAPSTVEGPHKLGTNSPSKMDGMQGELAEEPYCDEHGASNGECAASHPAPTTAEAFATVTRNLRLQGYTDLGETLQLLSLLERRMGAQERVLRRLVDADAAIRASTFGGEELVSEARAALTDAPPVFALEEVEAAMLEEEQDCLSPFTPGCTMRIKDRLTALRR